VDMQPLLDPTKIYFLFSDNLNGINIQSTVIRKDNQSGCLAGMKAFVEYILLL
jgi:hypothetical protein